MSGIAVYPRGFVGFDIGVVKAAPNIKDLVATVRAVEFNRQPPAQQLYPSNPVIDALWREYAGGSARMTSFAIRERVLKAALSAFGTTNFYDWCLLQAQNPFMTGAHKKFLNETFNFIETGNRSVQVGTWMNIIRINSAASAQGETPYQINKFFGIGGPSGSERTATLDTVIQCWTSQEGGFEDLLGTLAVLFGAI